MYYDIFFLRTITITVVIVIVKLIFMMITTLLFLGFGLALSEICESPRTFSSLMSPCSAAQIRNLPPSPLMPHDVAPKRRQPQE